MISKTPFWLTHFAAHDLTVTGLDGPGTQDLFQGTADNDHLDGTDEDDVFALSDGGNDHANGGDGDDLFDLGATLNAHDSINGGANGSQGDVLQLTGDYSAGLVLDADTIENIEVVKLLGATLGGGSYNLTLDDGNVAAGDAMTVVLLASDDMGDRMMINGSAETDGDLILQSAFSGDDVLLAGAGNDLIDGGAGGADVLDGGAGTNRVSFGQSASGVTVSLALQGAEQDVGGGRMVTMSNFQDLVGSAGDDSLSGDDNGNWLSTNGGNDTMSGGAGDDFLLVNAFGTETAVTVDGGQDNDTLSFFGVSGGVTVDLSVEVAQNVDGTMFVTLSRFENMGGSFFDDTLTGDSRSNVLYGDAGNDDLSGGDGSDVLYGDMSDQPVLDNGAGRSGFALVDAGKYRDDLDGGRGNDALYGGRGNDTLTGGAGQDQLYGGTGADVFVFKKTTDSRGSHHDLMDFSHASHDVIDLSRMDADVFADGDQAFVMVDAFTNTAGELRQFVNDSGHTIVSCDVNGDGRSDFQVELTTDAVLVDTDFSL